jgi:hypothetical protein
MAADTTLGSISILITGDTSRLQADFARATAIAISSGAQVSAAFNQSAQGADKVVAAIGMLAAVMQQESAAASLAAQRNIALLASQNQIASGTRQIGAAAAGAVPQVTAMSGAVRTAFGEQSIRAVERFLTLIPGLGVAVQALFPVIGALALAEAIGRVIGKSDDLKASEDALKKSTEQTDAEFAKMTKTIDQVNIGAITRTAGPAAGARAQAAELGAEARDAQEKIIGLQSQIKQTAIAAAGSWKLLVPFLGADLAESAGNRIKALGEQIQGVVAQISTLGVQSNDKLDESDQKLAEERGALASARLANEERANAATASMARSLSDLQIAQSHAVVAQQIAAMHDRESAAVATAAEEMRVAQAKEAAITDSMVRELPKRLAIIRQQGAAEAAGKAAPEQQRIGVETQGKVAEAETDAAREALDAHKSTVNAQMALDDANATHGRELAEQYQTVWVEALGGIGKAYEEFSRLQNEAFDRDLKTLARVTEIQDKARGTAAEDALKRQQLELQRGAVLAPGGLTPEQQAEASRAEADAAEREAGAKAQGLALAAQTAEVAGDQVRAANLNAEAIKTVTDAANARYAAETKILEVLQKQSLQYQVTTAAGKGLTTGLGGALAAGIFGGGKKGMDVGKQVADALKASGKQILGDVFTKAIEQMVIAITGNTVATNLNTIWTEVQALIPKPFGFAAGGTPPVGVASLVGEKGPELFIPRQAGTVVPAGKFSMSPGRLPSATGVVSSRSMTFSGDMHFYGVQNVKAMMRSIADFAKSSSPQYSPYSS